VGFGGVEVADKAVNDFSSNGMNFSFTTTATSLGAVSPGDLVIDFAKTHEVAYPKRFVDDKKPLNSLIQTPPIYDDDIENLRINDNSTCSLEQARYPLEGEG